MKNNLTVSLCIPAYNEEKSIYNIVKSCCLQIEENFVIEKIIVISDGSSDQTVAIAKSIEDPRIMVLEDGLRKGKSERLNDLNAIVNSDILIQFDADICLCDNYVVSRLVVPFLLDADVGLVSGVTMPFEPKTFSERVVNTGIELWNDTKKLQKNSQLYLSEGPIRALRKSFYKGVRFPPTSADEAFIFLECMSKGFKFATAPNAIAYFHLPSTFKDYVKQMRRFLKSKAIQEHIFDSKLVDKYYTITGWAKIKILLKYLFKQPFWVLVYLGYLIFPKILVQFNKLNYEGVWTIIESTKVH